MEVGSCGLWRGGEGGEDMGELAVDEEVAGRGGVVGLAQVSLDIRGDIGRPSTFAKIVVE